MNNESKVNVRGKNIYIKRCNETQKDKMISDDLSIKLRLRQIKDFHNCSTLLGHRLDIVWCHASIVEWLG